MVTRHVYARALRAHFITQLALGIIVLKSLHDKYQAFLDATLETYRDVFDRHQSSDFPENCAAVDAIKSQLQNAMNTAAEKSMTAKLWKQYFDAIELVRLLSKPNEPVTEAKHNLPFVQCSAYMIPHFHAAGHFAYAKSAQLYFQQMRQLEAKLNPAKFLRFKTEGLFTIRRSEKLWAGSWTDLVIEHFLMRVMKTSRCIKS